MVSTAKLQENLIFVDVGFSIVPIVPVRYFRYCSVPMGTIGQYPGTQYPSYPGVT